MEDESESVLVGGSSAPAIVDLDGAAGAEDETQTTPNVLEHWHEEEQGREGGQDDDEEQPTQRRPEPPVTPPIPARVSSGEDNSEQARRWLLQEEGGAGAREPSGLSGNENYAVAPLGNLQPLHDTATRGQQPIIESRRSCASHPCCWCFGILFVACAIFCLLEIFRWCAPPPNDACGGADKCQSCKPELGIPLVMERWRCIECTEAYHMVDVGLCKVNSCFCRNGTALIGSACNMDRAERCGKCDDGFHVDGFTCSENQCSCNHGSPVGPGPGCDVDGVEQCRVCDDGFHFVGGHECSENHCTCPGGTAPAGDACPKDDLLLCIGCNAGFQLHDGHCDAVVRVFNSGTYMHTDRGAPDMIADLKSSGHNASGFSGMSIDSWNQSSAAVLVVPELYVKLELGVDTSKALREWVRSGGHLIVCGDYVGHNGRFLNAVFSWTLQGVFAYDTPKLVAASCSIFCVAGPKSVEFHDEVSCYSQASLPSSAKTAYAADKNTVCVFTLPMSRGRVTYIGFDWYDTTREHWKEVLHRAVLGTATD